MSLVVPERWEPSPSGWYTCGDLAVAVHPNEPDRYVVWQLSDGQFLFDGRIPPSGSAPDDLVWFGAVLASDAANASDGALVLPVAGLEPWLEAAQEVVDGLVASETEERRLERAEVLARRVGRTASELLAEVPEETDWLVPGVLVPGWATKLAGREKSGKGTLVFHLLARLERGEPTVFGPSKQATSLILTEEPPESVREKVEAFGLQVARIVYGYELAKLPWDEKVTRLVAEARADGHGIVFVDNVSRSAAVEEEGGVELSRAVELLQESCREAGLALVLDHHHKKGRGAIEDKSRGGTGVAGAMDINVELERIGGLGSRKRRLTASGRLRATNWRRAIVLAEDGTDYSEVEDDGGSMDERDEANRLVDSMLLAQTVDGVTAAEFASIIGMGERTAQRRLKDLVEAGLASMSPGTKGADGKYAASVWKIRPRAGEPTT